MKRSDVDPMFETAYRVGFRAQKMVRAWHSGLDEWTLELMRLGLIAGTADRLRQRGWDVTNAFARAVKRAAT